MQERRTLVGPVNKGEIPSSAVEITANNYTTVQGNVLYFPAYVIYPTQISNGLRIQVAKVYDKNYYVYTIDGYKLICNYSGRQNEDLSFSTSSSANYVSLCTTYGTNTYTYYNPCIYLTFENSYTLFKNGNYDWGVRVPTEEGKTYHKLVFSDLVRVNAILKVNNGYSSFAELAEYYDPIYLNIE